MVVGPNQEGKLVQRVRLYRYVIRIPDRRGIAIPHSNIDGDILETHKPDAGFDYQGDIHGVIAKSRSERILISRQRAFYAGPHNGRSYADIRINPAPRRHVIPNEAINMKVQAISQPFNLELSEKKLPMPGPRS